MNFVKKTAVSLVLLAALMVSLATPAFAADAKIIVDSKSIVSDVAPINEGGRILVPIRVISESFGAKIDWNASQQKVTANTAGNNVEVVVGSRNASINGKAVQLDAPAKIVNGRTFVPLRFVGEALGANIKWDGAANAVNVTYFSDMTGTIKIGGSTTIQPVSEAIAQKLIALNSGKLSVTVAGTGSGDGVKGGAAGQYNIGNASRTISDSEKQTYPDLKDFQIGSDAIAVVIHPSNSVKSLTKQQVFDIYTGKITNWKDVGGSNAPIFVQTREEGSGTLGAFIELAIQTVDKAATITKTAAPHASNGIVKQSVSQEKNAIGFISLGYLDNTVKALNIEGVVANDDNALSGKYPYVRPLVVVTKGNPTGITAKFIDYYTSPLGKEILEKENYLPMK